MKYFYKMEKNWGFSGDGEADTADQDQDKTKTYDMCRIEYAHLNMILYIGMRDTEASIANLLTYATATATATAGTSDYMLIDWCLDARCRRDILLPASS